ncbi:hypothetical protein Isop_0775 [Isosphaera pallida ATCC 43644]|uniref:Uncharacterized protein n=1 Tax=Isosphaera pallida (strain ATCC 43644 / DSM 9630 / IS1B) TaxID=575540 RepID=E8R1U4_ISOPI|nr:hypothetical protein Isop_0775 [Isosphaera pallida ATCC 43644]
MNNTQPGYDIQTDLNSLWKWSVISTAVGLFLGCLMVFISWLRIGKSWPEPGDVNSRFFLVFNFPHNFHLSANNRIFEYKV